MQRMRAGAELGHGAGASLQHPALEHAYLAEPASRRGCGVLVVHEAGELGEFARDVCDRLAREGFVALAPAWSRPAQASGSAALLDAAVDALLGRDACEGARVGALGFGAGGALALELAQRSTRLGAVVTCWSSPDTAEAGRSGAAWLALVTEADAEPARALEARLRADGRRAAVRVLQDVSPGFLDAGRHMVFDAAAAARAWTEITSFLRAELK